MINSFQKKFQQAKYISKAIKNTIDMWTQRNIPNKDDD